MVGYLGSVLGAAVSAVFVCCKGGAWCHGWVF